ncbi:nuclear transport factor 2 family protein [Amycolatopsis magusensis]|uniref:nuclear transport factor 2 family protein n=1 Tax=Amycolatopsis magusensis TaxID=882444 RepID=UPI0037924DB9
MTNEFVSQVFEAVDSGDAATFVGFFSEQGRMVFANGEPMIGPAQIEAGVQAFFGTIKALRHTVVREWSQGSDTIVELTVEYDRLDGGTVTIPAVTIWHVDTDRRIDDYRVYFDVAPIYR